MRRKSTGQLLQTPRDHEQRASRVSKTWSALRRFQGTLSLSSYFNTFSVEFEGTVLFIIGSLLFVVEKKEFS